MCSGRCPQAGRRVIVHHRSEAVKAATRAFAPTYCHQPDLNGTGGALLAVRDFLEAQACERLLITMGDVPFVRPETYMNLVEKLETHHMVALGFKPADKKQYGLLETERDRVQKITEWKYCAGLSRGQKSVPSASAMPASMPPAVRRCSSISRCSNRVLRVSRRSGTGRMTTIHEYFLTDIIEFMNADGLSVGYVLAEDEMETMGVDDPQALEKAQAYYRRHYLEADCDR